MAANTMYSLNELASVAADVFPTNFVNNIKTIAACDHQAVVTQVLQTREDNAVNALRSQLLTDLAKVLPEYQCRTPIKRTSRIEIHKDIIQLMVSIVESKKSDGLENAYKAPTELQACLAHIINQTTKMQNEICTLKTTVKTQQQTITILTTDIASLKSRDIASPALVDINGVGNAIQLIEDTVAARTDTPSEEEAGTTPSTPSATTRTDEETRNNMIADQHSQNLQSSSSSSSSDNDADTESDTDSHTASPISRQRHSQRRERINPSSAQPTIDLFIGLLNNKNKRKHIQSHILTKAHVKVDKDKIATLNSSRNGKKNFKISVPQDKVDRVLSIWKSPIRAEIYRGGPKSTLIEDRGSSNNRTNSNRPNSNSRTYRTINQRLHNNRTNSNNRTHHANNQRFRGQSNHYNRWSRPQTPTYSRQYWDRYDEPAAWYPQQYGRYQE